MLTERKEGVGQLSAEHGAVLSLVVQLQALEEVLVHALVLVLLALAEEGQELVQGELLLTLLLGAAQLLNGGLGGVQVEGAEDAAEVDGVDGASAIAVVDGEHELGACGRGGS